MTESPPDTQAESGKTGHERKPKLATAIAMALEQFSALTGTVPHAVTGARPGAGDGWSVLIDVVELARIPESTSVMATYRVDLDQDLELCSCERLRRYTRGATDS